MRDLQSTIVSCFEDVRYRNCYNSYIEAHDNNSLYMTMPIIEDRFEMPLLGLGDIRTCVKTKANLMAVTLDSIGRKSGYKSLDASVRGSIASDIHNYHLVRLSTNLSEPRYYCTYGAIFNKDFMPVMMMTWELEKVPVEHSELPFKLRFVRPLLRISPEVVIYKNYSVERYIVNKIMPSALQLPNICKPYINYDTFFDFNYKEQSCKVRVIIEKIPFEIRKTDVPSISTTNEELLNVALDNLDELIQ